MTPRVSVSLFAPLRRLTWRFWVTFFVATALVEGGHLLFERAIESHEQPSAYVDSVFALTGLYQRVLSAPRRPVARYVAIVEINDRKDLRDVSAANVCAERTFLAELLKHIAGSGPALIVVDKFFLATRCAADDPGTFQLLERARAIQKSGVDVILGVQANATPSTSDPHSTAGSRAVLDDSLDFGDDGPSGAILNIAHDNRRLPLQWTVYETATAAHPVVKDTLALAAARSYEPRLLQRSPMLRTIVDQGEQPFIGFLDPEQFAEHHYYAGQVVCGDGVTRDTPWETCSNGPVPGLKNKIVLVGESSRSSDRHYSSSIGSVPGFYLQANYIEALLDDRYFRQGGRALDVLSGLLFLVGLELILIVYHGRIGATLFLVGVMTAVTYAVVYLTIMHIGWYIDPIPLSATVVAIKVLHMFYGVVRQEHPQARPEAAKS